MKSFSLLILALFATFALGAKEGGMEVPDGTCMLWGDPHIWTFDYTYYSFQDAGWHHVVVSDRVNIQSNFIKGCWTPDLRNACARDLRIFVLDDNDNVHSLELYLSETAEDGYSRANQFLSYQRVLVDGQDVGLQPVWDDAAGLTYPGVQAGVGIEVGSNGGGVAYYLMASQGTIYTLYFKFQDVIVAHVPNILTIIPTGQADSYFWGNVCGLCGTYTGTTSDDFQVQSSATRPQYLDNNNDNIDNFGETWNVNYQPRGVSRPADGPVFTCNFSPNPTPVPVVPTDAPTAAPTRGPTAPAPTNTPTGAPTAAPTAAPTVAPTSAPTSAPTVAPTARPTAGATPAPTTPASTTGSTVTPTSTPTIPPNKPNCGGVDCSDLTNNTVVLNANGTEAYTNAEAACANADLYPGDPLWTMCMYDVISTNVTSISVASAGALVFAGCSKNNITDTSCTDNTLFACPGACNGNGKCVAGSCQCNKGFQGPQCVKAPLLTAAQLAGVISAGAVAGIAIGAAVFAGLTGFGIKKGYDYYHMKDNKMANVNSNPLYNEKKTGGVSPLYAEKA